MTNPNEPAFVRRQVPKRTPGPDDPAYEHGLTKREYYAAMAMQALISNPEIVVQLAITLPRDPEGAAKATAEWAKLYADALLTAL